MHLCAPPGTPIDRFFNFCTKIVLSVISWISSLAQIESININPLRDSSPLPCPSFVLFNGPYEVLLKTNDPPEIT